ncbi:type II toxin-antitoxin system VapC family toxin [Dyadobacter sp. OTU695]|uniref:type II toxin-antitoxin system VapC family toxin n=1 Tax=Dyadobacter sp. OTU695 TaxID=3043860 RepID=UPI00313B057B
MIKYLLDTQIAIWSLEDNSLLKPQVRNILENPTNTLLISPISLIEISIKLKLGKLPQFKVSIEEATRQLLNKYRSSHPTKNSNAINRSFRSS